jgi:hypothetical protein
MSAIQDFPLKIQKLLLKNTVVPLKKLHQEFIDRSPRSLFRDLKKLDLITSFTHAGQYHALKKTAHFDQNGFWFFHDIGFSHYGTLKSTLVYLISHAQTGMTHKEIKTLCRVEVQKPLTDLVNSNTVTRQLLPSRIYVYLNADKNTAEDQLQRRVAIGDRVSSLTLPPESIRIEILVEVIQGADRQLDEQVLGPLLRKRGVIITDDQIAYVLTYYDIKKNGF